MFGSKLKSAKENMQVVYTQVLERNSRKRVILQEI